MQTEAQTTVKEPKSVDYISWFIILQLRTIFRTIQDSNCDPDMKAYYRVALSKHASRIGFDELDLSISDEVFNSNYKQGEL